MHFIIALFPILCLVIPEFASLPIFNDSMLFIMTHLNLIFLGLVAGLGFYLNQVRITISSVALIACYYALLHPSFLNASMGLSSDRLSELVAMALPLSIGLLYLQKEVRVRSAKFFVDLLIFIIPFLAFSFWMLDLEASYLHAAYFHFIDALAPLCEVPQIAIFPIVFLIAVAIYKRRDSGVQFLNALIVAMIPLIFASHVQMDLTLLPNAKSALTIVSFIAISLVLLITIFKMYWKRVYIDELTQIANRRALDENLNKISGQYTIGMIDIDHFKNFNDSYGHDAGDDVLKLVAKTIAETSRKYACFRYGGEEFTLLFRGQTPEECESIANKIRENIENRKFFIRKSVNRDKKNRGTISDAKKTQVQITISLGLADGNGLDPLTTIKNSDKALYTAKESGRNRVEIFKTK